MTTILGTVNLEITDSSGLHHTPKDLHLLKQRLAEALDEAAGAVLDQFGIVQENLHTVFVEELDVENEEETQYVD